MAAPAELAANPCGHQEAGGAGGDTILIGLGIIADEANRFAPSLIPADINAGGHGGAGSSGNSGDPSAGGAGSGGGVFNSSGASFILQAHSKRTTIPASLFIGNQATGGNGGAGGQLVPGSAAPVAPAAQRVPAAPAARARMKMTATETPVAPLAAAAWQTPALSRSSASPSISGPIKLRRRRWLGHGRLRRSRQ